MDKQVEKKEADAVHADAAQDKELIAKMLKKHLGEEPSEEVMKHACEAHMVACKAGMKPEEAAETVGHAMKMAKMMSLHKDEKPAEEPKEEPKEEEKKEAEEKKEEKAEAKEAIEEANKVLKLEGELAALRETFRKIELEKLVDAKLAATKLARSHTKTIRESLATCRNEAEVDQKISLFLEGYKLGGEADGLDWIVSAEKTTGVESGVSFADCAN